MKPKPLESFQAARKYLLGALCKESLCTPQIRQRLKRREVADEMIESLIEEMLRLGFVDDRAWVESFVRRQQAIRDGPMTIKHKLRLKGIDASLIAELVPVDAETQLEQIRQLLQGKYRKHDLNDYKQKQKVIAGLMRKGYSYDLLRGICDE
jgi:regulatory protein